MRMRPLVGVDARLDQLIDTLGLEPGARAYLEEVRWPDGVECPRCESRRIGFIVTREKHQCCECAYQFRPTAGTVLHDSHIPIADWLLAVGLMLSSERGYPANRLHAALGGSYKSAWFVEHRIRAAMANALLDLSPAARGQAREAQSRPEASGEATNARVDVAPEPVLAGLRLIKQQVAGDYHRPDVTYLNAYWAEARWRALHRDDKRAYRKAVKALLDTEPLSYERLTRHRPAR